MLSKIMKKKSQVMQDYFYKTPEKLLSSPALDKIWIGASKKGKNIFIPDSIRTMHAQVVGSTGSGKTESVILPWCIQDIFRGKSVVIIDGKADSDFLARLGGYMFQMGLGDRLKVFSLMHPQESRGFNPLEIGSDLEVSDRLFSSMQFSDPFYEEVQKIHLSQVVRLLFASGKRDLRSLYRLLVDYDLVKEEIAKISQKDEYAETLLYFKEVLALKPDEREKRFTGLKSQISGLVTGEIAPLLSPMGGGIKLLESCQRPEVLYFQLPTLKYRLVAPLIGKVLLQMIQGVASLRHAGECQKPFLSLVLDEFSSFAYDGFVELLNKARSANISILLSHQSIGDLRRVSDAFELGVLSNTNLKVIMRTLDPESAEFFASGFGTRSAEATTSQVKKGLMSDSATGMMSLREVREFGFHPDLLKSLPAGHAVVSVPTSNGVFCDLMKLRRLPVRPDVVALRHWH